MDEYQKWAEICKKIENKEINFYFKEREVWWCHLGYNIGNETNGKNNSFERPVLILKKINSKLFWGLPLTTKYKGESYKFCVGKIRGQYNYVLLDQLRTMSTNRLKEKFKVLNKSVFNQINKIVLSK